MKVLLKENVLEVNTEIAKADFDKKVTDMTVTDEKGNFIFELSMGSKGDISLYGLTCNSTIDGNLAVTIVLDPDTTENDVKVKYGKALVKAEKALEVLTGNIEADSKAIDTIFNN